MTTEPKLIVAAANLAGYGIGDEFHPTVSTNVEALIDGGFLVREEPVNGKTPKTQDIKEA